VSEDYVKVAVFETGAAARGAQRVLREHGVTETHVWPLDGSAYGYINRSHVLTVLASHAAEARRLLAESGLPADPTQRGNK